MRTDVHLHCTVVQQVSLELDMVEIFSSIAAAVKHNVLQSSDDQNIIKLQRKQTLSWQGQQPRLKFSHASNAVCTFEVMSCWTFCACH